MLKIGTNTIRTFIFVLLICLPSMVFAQQDDDPYAPSIETEWDDFIYDLYVRGDQTFIISLGTVFPALFLNNGTKIDPQFSPPTGGSGSLTYNYYLSSAFFLGGEFGLMFIHTLRRNTLFIIPLGFKMGTQMIYGRFEFPMSLTIGMTWHTYLDFGYYGLYMKADASAFYRAFPQWSFGLTTSLGWFPQWTDDKSRNVDGSFVNLLISARHHF